MLVFEVLTPSFKGTPIFPSFRKSKSEVLEDIAELKEELELKDLEAQKTQLESKLNQEKKDNQ